MTQMDTRGTLMGPLKGHLALNSSPYKPCINKLSTQHIIQDQMKSHYYNMATIKSAIDNKQPKSSNLSIKKRDQMRREILLKQLRSVKSQKKGYNQTVASSTMASGQRPKSAASGTSVMSKSPTSISPYETTAKHKMLHGSRPKSADHTSKRLGQNFEHRSATMSSFSSQSVKLSPRNGENTLKPNVLDLTYSGDYLDKHESRFKNSEKSLFTPRTKKRPGKSFLSQSHHYAPPMLLPKKKTSEKNNKKPEDREKITKTNLQKLEEPNIESDRNDDHRRWVEEQSEFVQRLALIEEDEQRKAAERQRKTSSRSVSVKSETRRLIDEEEEELKYLEFINEVTNDILSRGIYSDSVLNQMMERHVERRRGDLKVEKMWRMLGKLKRDLGMSERKGLAFASTQSLNDTFATAKYVDELNQRPHSSNSYRRYKYDETDVHQSQSSVPVDRPRKKSMEKAKTPSLASVNSVRTEKSEQPARVQRAKSPSLASVSSIKSERSEPVASSRRHESDVSDVFEPDTKDDVAELLISSTEVKPASPANSAVRENLSFSRKSSVKSSSSVKPSISENAPVRPPSPARSSASEKQSVSRRSSTTTKIFERPAPVKQPTPRGSVTSKVSTPKEILSPAESIKSDKFSDSEGLSMTLGPSLRQTLQTNYTTSERPLDLERPCSPAKSVASEKSLLMERPSSTISATSDNTKIPPKRTTSISSLISGASESLSATEELHPQNKPTSERLSSLDGQYPQKSFPEKSPTSSVKSEPAKSETVVSSKPPSSQAELSEEESDYESVVALSMVMKPAEMEEKELNESKINNSTVVSASTDHVKEKPVLPSTDKDEENNYSDDFESDDNF